MVSSNLFLFMKILDGSWDGVRQKKVAGGRVLTMKRLCGPKLAPKMQFGFIVNCKNAECI